MKQIRSQIDYCSNRTKDRYLGYLGTGPSEYFRNLDNINPVNESQKMRHSISVAVVSSSYYVCLSLLFSLSL
jgi:hypothetical protein